MNRRTLMAVGLLALLSSCNALAAVSLSATRLVFDGRFSEARLDVVNRGRNEVLIQSWLSSADNTDGNPDTAGDLPFVLTPHLAHLEGSARQALRVLYQGQGMAQDVESLLHLYVLEIPRRTESKNQMSIAIRQRINLFYRPPGLSEDPAATALRLRWTLSGLKAERTVLQVTNPTPYHAALQDVRLDGLAVSEYLLLAPGASQELPVRAVAGIRRLSFEVLNDYGGAHGYCARGDGDAFTTTQYRQKGC